jgi:hypothetical protein
LERTKQDQMLFRLTRGRLWTHWDASRSGLGLAFGANTLEAAQERQAILNALPAGYTYSGCNEVRAAGVAPLYSYEPGFSERLDGDGDGIGCEPYRGQ